MKPPDLFREINLEKENLRILKRIIRNRNAELPSGGEWHIELLKLFSKNSGSPFGILDENLFSQLSLMRKFRHVVMHGYGFTLDGEMAITALKETPVVVSGFLSALIHISRAKKIQNNSLLSPDF